MNIGCDIDGVVANFSFNMSILLRDRYGTDLPLILNKEQITHWDWEYFYPLSRQQIDYVFRSITDDFWKRTPILDYDDFAFFRDTMLSKGHKVHFITSRAGGKNIKHTSIKWLESYGWPNPNVTVIRDKTKKFKKINLDFHIDDSPDVLINGAQFVKNMIVMDYPYNRNIDTLKRVNNLTEYTELILSS